MSNGRQNKYQPDYAVVPGRTLLQLLDERGMSQVELARRTGLTAKHVNQIVKGQASITAETATRLERATGVEARVWLRLQSNHDATASRLNESVELEADVGWLSELPLRTLVDRGYIARGTSTVDQLRAVLNFFGVASREAFESVWTQSVAFRRSRSFESDPGSIATWLRIGELEATKLECQPFDRHRFIDALRQARELTLVRDAEAFLGRLQALCCAAGVAVVVVEETPKARVFGAARWLSTDRALIQLSFRQKSNDTFWFSFFHEARHILQETKRNTFLDGKDTETDPLERDADQFASDTLIPAQYRRRLHDLETISEVRDFAREIGVAPGIVVGRLHHLELKPYSWGASLKWRYEFSYP